MKIFYLVLIGLLVVGFFLFKADLTGDKSGQEIPGATQVGVIPINHATAIITLNDVAIYTDPVGGFEKFVGYPDADIILVTDIHGDHLSTSTLASVMRDETTLVVPHAVFQLLPPDLARRAKVLGNGDTLTDRELKILALPMYNLPELPDSRHTKGRGNGYIIGASDVRIYIAGDTAGIPEMRELKDINIAFIPMNLPYTMSVEEAADAVLDFKPNLVYPYHYRGENGLSDVAKFKSLVETGNPKIKVILENWYRD